MLPRPRPRAEPVRRALLAAALALAGLGSRPPPPPRTRSSARAGTSITYVAADATSINTVTARAERGRLVLRDTTVDGGIDPGPCRPARRRAGRTGWIVEVSCPARGTAAVRVDLGEREDSAVVRLPVPVVLRGGPGADALAAGAARRHAARRRRRATASPARAATTASTAARATTRSAGEDGADTLDAGLGRDLLDGGAGDDLLRGRDGQADDLRCGAGADRVEADTLDAVAADCEHVERAPIAPPPEPGAAGADERSPRVRAGAAATQPLGRVRILATSSERGVLSASGFLDVGGLSLPVQGDRRPVSVGGGGVVLRVRLAARERRRVLRALRRGRRATVRMGVVGTDRAGNSRLVLATPIRLRLPQARASHPEPGRRRRRRRRRFRRQLPVLPQRRPGRPRPRRRRRRLRPRSRRGRGGGERPRRQLPPRRQPRPGRRRRRRVRRRLRPRHRRRRRARPGGRLPGRRGRPARRPRRRPPGRRLRPRR